MTCIDCGNESDMRYCRPCHVKKLKSEGKLGASTPQKQSDGHHKIKVVGWALRGFYLPKAKDFETIEGIRARWLDATKLIGDYPEVSRQVEHNGVAETCREIIALSEVTPFTKADATALLERIRFLWEHWKIWDDVDSGKVTALGESRIGGSVETIGG